MRDEEKLGAGSLSGGRGRTVMCSHVKLVVQVKLLPTPEQAAALEATLRAANKAAGLVSRIAFQKGCFRNFDLRKHTYEQIKAIFGLAAQAAQHVIKKVCDAYRTCMRTWPPEPWASQNARGGSRRKVNRSSSARRLPSRTTTGAFPGSMETGRCRSGRLPDGCVPLRSLARPSSSHCWPSIARVSPT
ncbi:hypothetical protein ACI2LC_03310 [Nonomuraea wenchangensis]|uniref:hypothetical protein n=1 Tax=Nonomuraea wenchangensis TaxID=568860 RepID=UPI00341ACD17